MPETAKARHLEVPGRGIRRLNGISKDLGWIAQKSRQGWGVPAHVMRSSGSWKDQAWLVRCIVDGRVSDIVSEQYGWEGGRSSPSCQLLPYLPPQGAPSVMMSSESTPTKIPVKGHRRTIGSNNDVRSAPKCLRMHLGGDMPYSTRPNGILSGQGVFIWVCPSPKGVYLLTHRASLAGSHGLGESARLV